MFATSASALRLHSTYFCRRFFAGASVYTHPPSILAYLSSFNLCPIHSCGSSQASRPTSAAWRSLPPNSKLPPSLHRMLLSVDLEGCFETGQAYVALSRARSDSGLSVKNIRPQVVRTDAMARKFHEAVRCDTKAGDCDASAVAAMLADLPRGGPHCFGGIMKTTCVCSCAANTFSVCMLLTAAVIGKVPRCP